MARRVWNWARTEQCRPTRIERPADEAAVVALVRELRSTAATGPGRRLKVVGARHSWSAIAMGDDVLVSLEGMVGIVELDRDRMRVRVRAGTPIWALNDALAAAGFALAIVGSVVAQSIAGVVSTGTHGSSVIHGNLSTLVVGLRMVSGAGELLILDEDHPLLPAARVGLGALGIITEVTLTITPAFRLRETTEVLGFDEALAELQTLARSAEYVKLWWLPHTDQVIVFRYARTDEPGQASALWRWIDTWLINRVVFAWVLLLGRIWPGLIPSCNRLVAKTYLDRKPLVGRSDQLLSLAMPPRHRETEYAVSLADAADALRANREVIASTGVHVNFITELRFVAADDSWLSPARGRASAQLGAYMAEAPGLPAYFAAFEQAMRDLDGRPHWGKEFCASPEQLRRSYPELGRFATTARELDPDGLFRGRFLDAVLDDQDR